MTTQYPARQAFYLRVSLLLRLEEVASIRHPRSSRWMARLFFSRSTKPPFFHFLKRKLALKKIQSLDHHGPKCDYSWVAKDQAFGPGIHRRRAIIFDVAVHLGKLLRKCTRLNSHSLDGKDNCIGATSAQSKNKQLACVLRDHHIAFQFKLLKQNLEGVGNCSVYREFLLRLLPAPVSASGDLWGGNASCDSSGVPFIYDPASYYGDREADLAFTYMFGGFSSSFYDAYNHEYPLNSGFSQRKTLYNLYHELNHFNLFGGGYASSAQSSIDQLLSQL